MKTRALVIDDEKAMRESIAQWLELADTDVSTFADSAQALATISPAYNGVIVTDLRMPGIDGMGVLASVMDIDEDIPVVLITGHGDVNSAVIAMRQGAYDFIEKPFEPERLLSTVRRACEKRDLVMQNRALRKLADTGRSLEERLLGECSAMRRMRDEISRFAAIDVNVLLVGETGTGKEVIAHCLHDFGARANEPFIAIDCGALSSERIERTLFGESGNAGDRGPFERARGGTVLLDEVTNLSPDHQVKLLRVLEQREVQRVGDVQSHSLDIRLVSAANTSLDQALASDTFRRDLYFRLNTIQIQVPPLRHREDDCVLLFEHFTRQAARHYQREAPALRSQDITALRSHAWPGNVRELKNVAERFVLYQTQSVHQVLQADSAPVRKTLMDQVLAFEKSIIEYALSQCQGNIADTAEFLAVPRRTLNDKLQRHDIDRDVYLP